MLQAAAAVASLSFLFFEHRRRYMDFHDVLICADVKTWRDLKKMFFLFERLGSSHGLSSRACSESIVNKTPRSTVCTTEHGSQLIVGRRLHCRNTNVCVRACVCIYYNLTAFSLTLKIHHPQGSIRRSWNVSRHFKHLCNGLKIKC